MCIQMSMQSPDAECTGLEKFISSVQRTANQGESFVELIKNNVVRICTTTNPAPDEFKQYLEGYTKLTDDLNMIQATLQDAVSRYQSSCVQLK